jgi:hypothetical protein
LALIDRARRCRHELVVQPLSGPDEPFFEPLVGLVELSGFEEVHEVASRRNANP